MIKTSLGISVTLISISVMLQVFLPGEVNASPDIPTFFDMDKDGDGVISSSEADYWSALAKAWQRVDSNQDGVVDMREWNALDVRALSSKANQ